MIQHSQRTVRDLAKARTNNSTDTAYSKPPTTTEPTGDGVVEIQPTGAGSAPGSVMVMPYALGADGDTFNVRVIGWSYAAGLWVPRVIAEYLCTASTEVGVAGSTVIATERFADTLALVANMGVDGQNTKKNSPGDNTPATFTCEIEGARKIEFLFKKGAATSVNALYRLF